LAGLLPVHPKTFIRAIKNRETVVDREKQLKAAAEIASAKEDQ